MQTPQGVVEYEGPVKIDGVPGTSAPVALTFLNAAGSKTGRIFPTGNHRDYFDTVPVTCIDMATPVVIIPAEYLGKTGYESPEELDADSELLARMESIRCQAGLAMGLGMFPIWSFLNLSLFQRRSRVVQLLCAILCLTLAIKRWRSLALLPLPAVA